MSSSEPVVSVFEAAGIPKLLAEAMAARGFDALTPVQTALASPELAGRDVVVSAQTGSGKTVAFGVQLVTALEERATTGARGVATPRALVVAPTRELAAQVREELSWLLAPLDARVLAVTGGTSVRGELSSLARGADVVVGTPGRLVDHLTRGALSGEHVHTLVLDEADEMLDMGFREALETILGAMPKERRTLMLSATFPRAIIELGGKYLRNPERIAVDAPGAGHGSIDFVAHVVPLSHRFDTVVNLLLTAPDDRTMVFVRTRAEAVNTGDKLADLGFSVGVLQGEMAQRERTQTLDAFRAGRVRVLVATDVAARGLDVPEVSQVIHSDLPGDPSALTHRSGRTGRAGRRGTSVLLVPPQARSKAGEMLRVSGARAVWQPPPGRAEIERAAHARWNERFASEDAPTAKKVDAGTRALAEALVAQHDPAAVVAQLLTDAQWRGPCEARAVAAVSNAGPPPSRSQSFSRDRKPGRGESYRDRDRAPGPPQRAHFDAAPASATKHPRRESASEAPRRAPAHDPSPRSDAPRTGENPRKRDFAPADRPAAAPWRDRTSAPAGPPWRDRANMGDARREPFRDGARAAASPRREGGGGDRENFEMFTVNMGTRDGATAARVLAMVCRRGGVRGAEVGAIRIGPRGATFGVAKEMARAFEKAASRPDEREPSVRIERVHGEGAPTKRRATGG